MGRFTKGFIIGICVLLGSIFLSSFFENATGFLRFIELVLIVAAFISFISIVVIFPATVSELKARISISSSGLSFYKILYYSLKLTPLLIGVLVFYLNVTPNEFLPENYVEISGTVSSIEIKGGKHSSLLIKFKNNTNRYGIRTFRLTKEKLDRISENINIGHKVFLTISKSNAEAENKRYIDFYSLGTENKEFYSFDDYKESDSKNSLWGIGLGIFFIAAGIVFFSKY